MPELFIRPSLKSAPFSIPLSPLVPSITRYSGYEFESASLDPYAYYEFMYYSSFTSA